MWDEKVLINKCLAGDHAAITGLYKTYGPVLYPICLRYSGSRDDANDLLHDCFIRIIHNLGDFRFQGSFEGWMKRIAVNTAINQYHKSKREQMVSVDSIVPVEDETPDVLDQLQAQEIIALISTLPEGYRQVFNLFAVEGYKHKEIADMLGITENTSKTQFFKAKKWLIIKLNELYPQESVYNQSSKDELEYGR